MSKDFLDAKELIEEARVKLIETINYQLTVNFEASIVLPKRLRKETKVLQSLTESLKEKGWNLHSFKNANNDVVWQITRSTQNEF